MDVDEMYDAMLEHEFRSAVQADWSDPSDPSEARSRRSPGAVAIATQRWSAQAAWPARRWERFWAGWGATSRWLRLRPTPSGPRPRTRRWPTPSTAPPRTRDGAATARAPTVSPPLPVTKGSAHQGHLDVLHPQCRSGRRGAPATGDRRCVVGAGVRPCELGGFLGGSAGTSRATGGGQPDRHRQLAQRQVAERCNQAAAAGAGRRPATGRHGTAPLADRLARHGDRPATARPSGAGFVAASPVPASLASSTR